MFLSNAQSVLREEITELQKRKTAVLTGREYHNISDIDTQISRANYMSGVIRNLSKMLDGLTKAGVITGYADPTDEEYSKTINSYLLCIVHLVNGLTLSFQVDEQRIHAKVIWSSDDNGVYTLPELCLIGKCETGLWHDIVGDDVVCAKNWNNFVHNFVSLRERTLACLEQFITRVNAICTDHITRASCINVFGYFMEEEFVNNNAVISILCGIANVSDYTPDDVYDAICMDPIYYSDMSDMFKKRDSSIFKPLIESIAKLIVNGDVVG